MSILLWTAHWQKCGAGRRAFQAKKEVATDQLPPSQDSGSNPTVDFQKQKRSNQTPSVDNRSLGR